MTLQTHKVFTRGCTLQSLMKLLALGLPSTRVCWAVSQAAHPSGSQSVCQAVSQSVSPPALPACPRNVSAQLIPSSNGCSPAWLVPLQKSETPSRSEKRSVQTYRGTPRKLLLLLTAKPNLLMGQTLSAVRLCQTQRSPRQHKVLLSPVL